MSFFCHINRTIRSGKKYNQNLHRKMTVDKENVAKQPEQPKADEINE